MGALGCIEYGKDSISGIAVTTTEREAMRHTRHATLRKVMHRDAPMYPKCTQKAPRPNSDGIQHTRSYATMAL